jgi:hypothetical protein
MSLPKFLYHGTSGKIADQVLSQGLQTRSQHMKTSNWQHSIESNPDAIYLTDSYAPYFAVNATEIPEHGTLEWEAGGYEAAVIQIDVNKLDHSKLVPDEDVLEQSGRKRDRVGGSMKLRTRWYRNRIHKYAGTDAWLTSLKIMGTLGHMGSIPVEAITRIAYWDLRKAPTFTFDNMDAIICLANYQFVGDKYRNFTNMLFELPLTDESLLAGSQSEYILQAKVRQAALKTEIDRAKRIIEL